MELYKYMPVKIFEKYIINGPTIRFTPHSEFNDPFEFYAAISGYKDENIRTTETEHEVRKVIEEKVRCAPRHERGRVRKILEKNMGVITKYIMKDTLDIVQCSIFYEKLYQKMGVFCASEKKDHILMWSHYAEYHKGIVISFNSDDSFFKKIPGPLGEFRKVSYRKKRLILPAEEMLNPEQWYTKSDMWEYEHEYRLVSPLIPEANYDWVTTEKIGTCRIPKSVIKSVTFGCKCSNEQINDWRNQLSAKGGFEHLKFYKAEMDKLEYKLNIVPLA